MKTIWSPPPVWFGLVLVTFILCPLDRATSQFPKTDPAAGSENPASAVDQSRGTRGQPAGPAVGAPRSDPAPYDVVILGGRVIDGTGNAWFHGDVALKGDRIVRVEPAGMLEDAPANERIDANGLVVCPGFIDIQSHSREALLDRRRPRHQQGDAGNHDRDHGRRLVERPGQ